jgi:uncharacterized membrane protein YwzB
LVHGRPLEAHIETQAPPSPAGLFAAAEPVQLCGQGLESGRHVVTFWSILSATYIGFITFGEIPESNIRFADTILGFVLGTMVASMFQFLLGSSLGSRKKDEKK